MISSGARKASCAGRCISRFRASTVVHIFVFATLLRTAALPAQSATTGAIAGRVVDALGLAIPAAELTIADIPHAVHISVRTGPTGAFLVPSLPPSEYSLGIRSSGFRPWHLKNVRVELGSTAGVVATLVPSTLKTEVTVTADSTTDLEDPPAATSTGISPFESLSCRSMVANGKASHFSRHR